MTPSVKKTISPPKDHAMMFPNIITEEEVSFWNYFDNNSGSILNQVRVWSEGQKLLYDFEQWCSFPWIAGKLI